MENPAVSDALVAVSERGMSEEACESARAALKALSGCELAADDAATRDAWAAAIRGAIAAPG